MSDSPESIEAAIEALRASPRRTAILTDLDGTLAEIVDRPEDARISEGARTALERIADEYALAGVITGRRAEVARDIAGVDRLTYVGNHGAERLDPGAGGPEPMPGLEGEEGRAAEFVASLDAEMLGRLGLSVEDKGVIRALHWRSAPDREAAAECALEIAAVARAAGLGIHEGRMVLELRPDVDFDKGQGLLSLLDSDPRIEAVFYAGDDRTDVDAFTAMRDLRDEGRLSHSVSIGVISSETPPEVAAEADFEVGSIHEYVEILGRLA